MSWPDNSNWLVRLLHKPLFGTRVIPRDAAVDPQPFPDDEFPVWCERCGYLLCGLPDGKCPECGTKFVRSQRLVHNTSFRQGPGAMEAIGLA
jgi:hypothetical protein